jgi:putative spermidine/putrescine transport system substrate-binding protein
MRMAKPQRDLCPIVAFLSLKWAIFWENKMKLTRPLIGAALLSAVAGSAFAGSDMASEMTIVSWGGAYSKSQQLAYDEPYVAKTGTTIINDESSAEAVAKLRAMNEAGNVTWDVVDVVAADAIRLCDEGLALEIDADTQLAAAPDGTPASEDFGDLIVSKCFIPQIVYSTTFGYRTDLVGATAPSSICDVFDLQKYPGKRSLEKRPINNMEWALLCDGVAKADVYKVLGTDAGQEQALAKLDTIKDSVIWWSAGADTPQLLADAEIVMGSTYNGRLFSVIEEQKQPVAMLWDAQVFDLDGWIIPTGLSPERQARALDYVKFATDTQRLADQAKYISYGPARLSSAPLVGKHATLGIDMAPHMPTDPNNAKNTFLYNYEFWADFRDDIDAKFQAWLAG